MDEFLDIRTMFIVLFAMQLFAGGLLTVFYLQQSTIPGLREWAVGMSLVAFGAGFLFARGMISDFASIVAGNLLHITGDMFLYIGALRFFTKKANWWWISVLWLVFCVPYFFTYHSVDYLELRIHLANFGSGAFLVLAGLTFVQNRKAYAGHAYVWPTIAFFLVAVSGFSRSFYIFVDDNAQFALMQTGLSSSLYFSTVLLGAFLGTTGLMMLTSERLRHKVESALTQERLAMREQNDFWAMVSHEFRTPLATISASAQLLDRSPDLSRSEDREEAGRIHRAAERLSGLVDKCVVDDWTNKNLETTEKSEIHIADVLRGLALEYDVPLSCTGNFTVLASGGSYLFTVAISSLLDNALKYGASKSGVEIKCDCTALDHVVIEIFDDGPGVKPEDRLRIFDKFYRSEKQDGKTGVGYGLYITKKIVEMHQGTIVTDRRDKTVFRITIPKFQSS